MAAMSKVLLLEFNEINWRVIDTLIAQRGESFLPNFGRLRKSGAWMTQSAIERTPLLDPWITWVTLHTGVPPEVHGASVLEQSSDTIKAKRTWQYASDAGLSVGIFGSISAYPPVPVKGFMVPGPFAPGNETYPPELMPVQALNRGYTQVHAGAQKAPGLGDNLKTAASLIQLGLKPSTLFKIAGQLVKERTQPETRWKRVCLQPALNFDIFKAQYLARRPDFATWHSNHAAHFMHHHWRDWDDSDFPVKSSAEDRRKYGEAVPYGYQLCDELLGKAMEMIDDDTVLMLASSMGQQPYISERYSEGKYVVRIKDIDTLLDLMGRDGITDVVPTMVPQWNLTIPDAARRDQIKRTFEAVVRRQAGHPDAGFAVQETHDLLTITPLGLAKNQGPIEYEFTLPDGKKIVRPLKDLFQMDTPTVKQGMHHIDGILAFWGKPVRAGKLQACTNLDVAPTILSLLGVPVPAEMPGSVLPVLRAGAGHTSGRKKVDDQATLTSA
jgi:Type I phosphodiesterase / nucleotide pyrophosphatase